MPAMLISEEGAEPLFQVIPDSGESVFLTVVLNDPSYDSSEMRNVVGFPHSHSPGTGVGN